MIPRNDQIIIRGRNGGPLLLDNVGPRGVTAGDDIIEVRLDLRGVAYEKGCYHYAGKKWLWLRPGV